MKILILPGPVPVLHAVETRQVGAGFCGCNDIVGRNRIFHHPQIKELHLSPLGFQKLCPLQHCCSNLIVKALAQIIGRNPNLHSLCLACQRLRKVIVLSRHRSTVLFVVGSQDFQDSRAVGRVPCHRPYLIQRRTVSNQTVSRNCPIGRFNPGHTAEGAGLPDGTARIGAECIKHFAGCHGGTGTA